MTADEAAEYKLVDKVIEHMTVVAVAQERGLV
jgi:hypothetical protein